MVYVLVFSLVMVSGLWFNYKLFNKRKKGLGIESDNRFLENKELAEEIHKSIMKNFKRKKVYSSFKDNIWSLYVIIMSRTRFRVNPHSVVS